MTNGALELWAPTVKSHARFVDSTGKETSVDVVKGQATTATENPHVRILAAPPLATDTWYWLVITRDDQLRMLAPSLDDNLWAAHFFAGSALRPIQMHASSQDPTYVTVTFSEPMGSRADRCGQIHSRERKGGWQVGAECMTPGEQFLSTMADVRLTVPFEPKGVELTLAGTVMGSGVAVEVGAQAA